MRREETLGLKIGRLVTTANGEGKRQRFTWKA